MIIGIDASRANTGQRTGTERYALEMVRGICQRAVYQQIRLYLRETPIEELNNLGPQVEVRILSWWPGLLWSHLRLSWELWFHAPDVLFVPADTVPIVHPVNTVTTIHDVAFERFPELYRGASVQRRLGWLRPLIHLLVRLATKGQYSASERDYHRWSVRHALRTCRRTLTVSEFTKRELVELFKVEPNRITVTPLGVKAPSEYDSLDQKQISQNLERIGVTSPYALFIGRLESKKNISLIIRAYLRYRQHHSDGLDLVLVGPAGYGWSEAQTVLLRSELKQRVHCLGWQPDEMVVQLQSQAKMFLFPSRYEGFGIPALESLSAGVPVIASRAGSLPEVLGPTAYYIDKDDENGLAEGIYRLTTDHDLRQQLITSGRAWAKQYTWDKASDLTYEVLSKKDLP